MTKLRTILFLLVSLAASANVATAADPVQVIAPGDAPADAVKIDIAKMKYSPATVEVEEGGVVLWTNNDAMPHNVQINDPFKIVGNMLRAGQQMAIKFNKAGEYPYSCTPHPFMKGGVKVKPKG